MRDHGQRGQTPPVIRDVGEDDGDVFIIAIREADVAGSWTLTFMEPYDVEDPQEIRLGTDTYCLVVDPGQATHYGGVRECVLDGERLRLTLTAEAADSLGMPVGTSFRLELSPQQVDLLSRGLARVLTSGRADEVPQRLTI